MSGYLRSRLSQHDALRGRASSDVLSCANEIYLMSWGLSTAMPLKARVRMKRVSSKLTKATSDTMRRSKSLHICFRDKDKDNAGR